MAATIEGLIAQLRNRCTVTLAEYILSQPKLNIEQAVETLQVARSQHFSSPVLYFSFLSRFAKNAETSILRNEIENAKKEGWKYAISNPAGAPLPHYPSWENFLVTNFLAKGEVEKALEIVEKIRKNGEKVLDFTYVLLMDKLLGIKGGLEKCLKYYREAKPKATHGNTYIKVFYTCIKENKLEEAVQILKWMEDYKLQIPEHYYHSLFNSLVKEEKIAEMLELGKRAKEKGISLFVNYQHLAQGFVDRGKLQKCIELVEQMDKMGIQIPLGIFGAMMREHCRKGEKEKCEELAREMRKKGMFLTVSTYNNLILAFAQQGDEKALQFFDEMHEFGLLPNSNTYDALCVFYAHQRDVQKCKETINLMNRAGFAISSTFAKLFKIFLEKKDGENMWELLEVMKSVGERGDKFLFSDLIFFFGKQGDVAKCLELKKMMEKEGTKPSVVTFAALIQACGIAGDLQKCDELMKEMVKGHNIAPNLHIFYSLFNAFGKANKKERIEGWYNNMLQFGVKPNDEVLESLQKHMGEEWMRTKGLEPIKKI